jgi:site-specific DNA-methyltransferase (adenine-specific)
MIAAFHITVAMKPLDGNFAQNAIKHSVAGLNIDGCRITVSDNDPNKRSNITVNELRNNFGGGIDRREPRQHGTPNGRFPANVLHDGSEDVLAGFPDTGRSPSSYVQKTHSGGCYGPDPHGRQSAHHGDTGSAARFFKQINELKE